MFKTVSDAAAAYSPQDASGAADGVAKGAADAVFRAMFGFYGNLWLSKFSTGSMDADGNDAGVLSAKAIWEHGLRDFDVPTVKAALRRCIEAHAEFPPTMPQFVALCKACQPVKTYAEQQGWKQLPAPSPEAPKPDVTIERKNDGKNWARKHLARHKKGIKVPYYTLNSARMALGLQSGMDAARVAV